MRDGGGSWLLRFAHPGWTGHGLTMAITLIGYRGCGKSTVARPLAEALGWDWIDADVELERRAGKSIRDIFATDGEPVFRDLEESVLTDLLAKDRLVVAAGGGSVMRESTRRRIQSSGPVIWLLASVETLLQRIQGDATTAARRPSLTGLDPRAEIERLLALREPIYRETATLIVGADNQPIADIVSTIVERLSTVPGFPSTPRPTDAPPAEGSPE